ncbi:MAG: heme A synthase [Rickettsiaceae bacterium]|nr:MAG: heme A synthase [Rickettsiaceae bacterium]
MYKNFWLLICLLLVASMIVVGGFTRLSNSGLSITEWKPITGVIPPISDVAWDIELHKYKHSPEYIQHNFDINLQQFKFIYLTEFVHRLLGRITVLTFILPMIFFHLKGRLRISYPYLLIGFLFCFQGFMGWYTVKSGLISNPHVSHLRLASHLTIAFIIYGLIFWQFLENSYNNNIHIEKVNLAQTKRLSTWSLILLLLQIYLGGLVAGLEAGKVYNSFPLMGHSFIPEDLNITNSLLVNINNPVLIQFVHRLNSYLLMTAGVALSISLFKTGRTKLRVVASCIIISLVLQMLLGIFTLLKHVPMNIALLHQAGAIFVLSALIYSRYVIKKITY